MDLAELKKNIVWLISHQEWKSAASVLEEVQGILSAGEIFALQAELELGRGRYQEAAGFLEMGLKKEPCNIDLLQLNLYFAQNIMKNETEVYRVAALLSMLTGENIIAGQTLSSQNLSLSTTQLRVLHGTMEIANQINTLAKGLKFQPNLKVGAVNYYSTYLDYAKYTKPDFFWCKNQRDASLATKMFAADKIVEYDIFHFHFGTSLTLDYSDLPLYEKLNKKIVMHYWGSEVRQLSIARTYNPYVMVKTTDEQQIIRNIENISQHVSNCLVADAELYLYVKDYFPNIYFLPQAIDLAKYLPVKTNKVKKTKPLLVHAPTHSGIKGTEYVLKAIEALRSEFDFDFQLIQGMKHEEALKIYCKADLVIDQLLAGSYGLFAIEAMALGKPVICWISEYMQTQYPKELPILIANPDTITEKLRYFLQNQDVLPQIGNNGRTYVERYHDSFKVAKQLVDIYRLMQ